MPSILEAAQALTKARIESTLAGKDTLSLDGLKEAYVQAVQAEPAMTREAAESWFDQEVVCQMLSRSQQAAGRMPAKAPADPLLTWARLLTILLIAMPALVIFRGMTQSPEGSRPTSWLVNGIWILAIVAYPLYKLLMPLIFTGLDALRNEYRTYKGWQDVAHQIAENKNWVWWCRRCDVAYPYGGQASAQCGRCGDRLMKVRGMSL